MTAFLLLLQRLPLWLKVAVPSVVIALLLCNYCNRPVVPHNFAADSLAVTRKAFAEDTLRFHVERAQLLALADSASAQSQRHLQALHNAERELLAVHATVAQLTASLPQRTDSVRARDEIIAAQSVEITAGATALSESKAAFDRLTAKDQADSTRADQAEAGQREAIARLGIAERAYAVEHSRVGCSINLIVTRVKCPSRGVMLVTGVVAGVVGYRLSQKAKP